MRGQMFLPSVGKVNLKLAGGCDVKFAKLVLIGALLCLGYLKSGKVDVLWDGGSYANLW